MVINKDDTAKRDIQPTENLTQENNNPVKNDSDFVKNDNSKTKSGGVENDEKYVNPSAVVVVDVQYLRSQEL